MINTAIVRDWMAAAQQPGASMATTRLYERLVREEIQELQDAYAACDARPYDLSIQAEVLDGIVDSVWCLIGLAHAMGFDFDRAFSEVARSNQSKIDPVSGLVEKDETGKVRKPEQYSPPSLQPYVRHPVQLELDFG